MEGTNQVTLLLNQRRLAHWLIISCAGSDETKPLATQVAKMYLIDMNIHQNMPSAIVAISTICFLLACTYSLFRSASGFIIGLDMALCFMLVFMVCLDLQVVYNRSRYGICISIFTHLPMLFESCYQFSPLIKYISKICRFSLWLITIECSVI
jgi:hypothetical protein